MSGYSKPGDSYGYDYTPSTRPGQSYAAYASPAPAFVSPQQYPPTSRAEREVHGAAFGNPLPLLAPNYPPPRDVALPPFGSKTSLPVEIVSTGPYHGSAGDELRIIFRSKSPYPPQRFGYYIIFGYKSVRTALVEEFFQDPFYRYTITAQVPEQGDTGVTMPLMLDIHDENQLSIEQKSLGHFFYPYQAYSTTDRKRKHSEDPSEFFQAKRSASQPLLAAKYKGSSSILAAGEAVPPMPTFSTAMYSPYERLSRVPYGPPALGARQQPSYGYAMSPSLAPQSLKVRSPRAAGPSSSSSTAYGTVPRLTPVQSPRVAPQSAVAMTRSLSTSSNPTLVRTTSIRSPAPPAPHPYGDVPAFNPYSIYPNAKAVLTIVGDLGSMCDGWSPREAEDSRRLVEFERSQTGSAITATFRAVTQDERSPNNACVSCIYWARRGEYYVTSVDTIGLLEALVAVRFTVEEKNRIRRNLEGFKPYTVSKNKDECDDIFRLIMGFPSPKPRNIEKDIKIFPWASLGQALKKIIGKYSASYASTIGLMEPAAGGAGFASTLSEAAEAQLPTTTGGASLASAYPLSAAALDVIGTPQHHQQHHHHAMRSVASMSHLQQPESPQQHHLAHWPGAGYSSQYVSASLPSARQWDLSAYLEPGPTAAASSAASYYRERGADQPEQQTPQEDEQQQRSPSRYGHVQQTSRA